MPLGVRRIWGFFVSVLASVLEVLMLYLWVPCSAGLTTEEEDMPHIIEADQGDSISGKISRAEVAQVISQALEMPAAAGKGCIACAACCNVHQCIP